MVRSWSKCAAATLVLAASAATVVASGAGSGSWTTNDDPPLLRAAAEVQAEAARLVSSATPVTQEVLEHVEAALALVRQAERTLEAFQRSPGWYARLGDMQMTTERRAGEGARQLEQAAESEVARTLIESLEGGTTEDRIVAMFIAQRLSPRLGANAGLLRAIDREVRERRDSTYALALRTYVVLAGTNARHVLVREWTENRSAIGGNIVELVLGATPGASEVWGASLCRDVLASANVRELLTALHNLEGADVALGPLEPLVLDLARTHANEDVREAAFRYAIARAGTLSLPMSEMVMERASAGGPLALEWIRRLKYSRPVNEGQVFVVETSLAVLNAGVDDADLREAYADLVRKWGDAPQVRRLNAILEPYEKD